ncbi:MAG: c-type cytochrome [Saprospiraceae bacterium]
MKPIFETPQERTVFYIQSIVYLLVLVAFAIVFLVYQLFCQAEPIFRLTESKNLVIDNNKISKPKKYSSTSAGYWHPLDMTSIAGSALESQILYGKDLIQNTSKYLGPKGAVAQISNGMNCQNCHLDAGTKIYGNNYGSVASTYPKFRSRSGSEESIYKRVNDCIERSLNGLPLDTESAEMLAIKAYLLFLGKNVEKGTVVNGSGLKDIPYLDRAADSVKGRVIYIEKCTECHQKDGQGIMAIDKISYTYPPLWGRNSYNDGAGLYRLSNFAKYVKYNMPLGATYEKPQLSDEEVWDVAAYVNSQPRPHKHTPDDWPDITKKPVDHPFGPFSDSFDIEIHKYGPYQQIIAAKKNKKPM